MVVQPRRIDRRRLKSLEVTQGKGVIPACERGPAGLINTKAPGNPSKLNDEQRQALAKIVDSGPIPAIHGVVRWRRKDLVQWIFEKFARSTRQRWGAS